MKAERGVGHNRTQHLAGDDDIVDRHSRRKDAGKERVQRAAIIRVVACASVRMCASVVTMTAGLMFISVVGARLVVADMRNGGPGSRAS